LDQSDYAQFESQQSLVKRIQFDGLGLQQGIKRDWPAKAAVWVIEKMEKEFLGEKDRL
jgi:hypothetical protein